MPQPVLLAATIASFTAESDATLKSSRYECIAVRAITEDHKSILANDAPRGWWIWNDFAKLFENSP
jgi:hypothetical protein